jgi:hypothetical protein
VRPQVLQQACYHLNHDTAEQLSSQQNTDSYTFQSRPTELNFQKSHDYSNRTWLNCLKLSCCCGVQGGSDGRVARTAGHYVIRARDARSRIMPAEHQNTLTQRRGYCNAHNSYYRNVFWWSDCAHDIKQPLLLVFMWKLDRAAMAVHLRWSSPSQ